MNPVQLIHCEKFPCGDVDKKGYVIPDIEIEPENVKLIMISEAAPANHSDHYYAAGNPSFQETTVLAFNDAGFSVKSINDLLKMGVYFTTAVKCAKTGYSVETATVKECSFLLEKELKLFQHVQAYLLMGDVAIKAVNQIAIRNGIGRVIPAGSTYKIRGHEYFFKTIRVFPSYLQVGPSFKIEKTKRRMIAEDISKAMKLII